jgi:glycosyltransferase involved in cell wall biosynthesis
MPQVRPYWAEKTAGALFASAWALAAKERPDVFHLHSVAAGAMAPLLRLRRVPCILQMHGIEWQRSRWGATAKATLRIMEKISFLNARVVTAVSQSQSVFYRARYQVPVSFIPAGTEVKPPVDPVHFAEIGIQPRKYFMTAARLVKEKGLHYLIPAFQKVKCDWKLVIAGADGGDMGYVQKLRQLAAGDCRILFLGHVEASLLDELYSNAGAYVQASEIEGMSLSLLDAMSFGNCCLASDIPSNLEVLGDSGITFRNFDIEDLISQLSTVVQSPNMIASLGLAARSRVHTHFTWERVTDMLEDLYLSTVRDFRIGR